MPFAEPSIAPACDIRDRGLAGSASIGESLSSLGTGLADNLEMSPERPGPVEPAAGSGRDIIESSASAASSESTAEADVVTTGRVAMFGSDPGTGVGASECSRCLMAASSAAVAEGSWGCSGSSGCACAEESIPRSSAA